MTALNSLRASLGAHAARTLIASLCLVACGGTAHVNQPKDALSEPGQVLARVAENTARRQRLVVEARVSYYGEEGARKAKAIILARRPAAMHFSALSPTDDLVAMLASDGQRFTSFQRGADVCYTGRSCRENVARFSMFPMEGAQLVDVLVGGVPVIEAMESEMAWDERAGAYRIELRGAQNTLQRIWVAHGTWDVKRSEVLRDGKLQVNLVFDDVAVVAGERLPHTIDMKMPSRNSDLRVRYRDVELNTEISDDAFAVPCPAGTRVETLLCYDERSATQDSPEPVELAPTTDPLHE